MTSKKSKRSIWLALSLTLTAGGVPACCRHDRAPATGAVRPELRVFRVRAGAVARADGRLAGSDELAFAYRNGGGKRHLFVFGVDEHRHIFWYSPAWTTATERPAAPVIARDGDLHEIERAVRHRHDGARLDIHALFTDRAWEVRELDELVARAPRGVPPSFDEVPLIQTFEVTP
jgi:hypothetical protein